MEDIRAEAYFSGDALDYVVFELDVFNNSSDSLIIYSADVFLEVFPAREPSFIVSPIDKNSLIRELETRHREIKSEKKAYNIVSGIGIGLGLLSIGTGSSYPVLNGVAYASESAAVMIEDNRAYSLLAGSLEDQIAYVDDWVLDRGLVLPESDNSWDILFPRRLMDAPATFVLRIGPLEFRQAFDLVIREEKLR